MERGGEGRMRGERQEKMKMEEKREEAGGEERGSSDGKGGSAVKCLTFKAKAMYEAVTFVVKIKGEDLTVTSKTTFVSNNCTCVH